MEDFEQRLNVLRERNSELERRREKLRELSQNLDENIQKIQSMYEAMLASQENQCIDMVAFDEEIKAVTKELFPPQTKKPTVRSRNENRDLLMQQVMALQSLEPKACEDRLHELDPLLKQVTQETSKMATFIQKYCTFLVT
jgi:ATP phosphoribosyltransferase